MILPTTPENRPFRIPAPPNRPVPSWGSPKPTSASTSGRARFHSIRSSTVPPRPVAHESTTPKPSLINPSYGVLLKAAQSDAEAGEYWLALKDGREPWPIVICNEEMIEKFFSDNPRPANARRADGTWRKKFRPRGDLTGQKCFPAMYLGTWKL